MRHGWEIKKLGEIGTIVGGSTPKTNIPEYWGEGYPWITPAELNGSKYVNATERTITEEALKHTNLTLLPVGSVLLSSRAPIGKVAITAIPLYCNQGFKNIVCGPSINNEYVYWFLIHRKEFLISLGRGATFKEISKHIVEQVSIPVPPLQEQEKIVAELDCLTGIIEKQKVQLKELDTLAQSIFYDMFGDPTTNEKGWETKSMKDVCDKLYAGGDVPKERFSKTKTAAYSIPILSNGKGDSALYGFTDIPRETSPAITISGRGTIGYSRIQVEPFYPIIRLIVAVPKPIINIIFLQGHISLMTFESTGGAIPQLTIPMVKNRKIIIPPLDLQNAFAQKIEAIEKQKELVKRSIQETETLFNSRMDYWFN